MILNNKQSRPVVTTSPTVGTLVLFPGVNEIPDDVYAGVKPQLEGAGLFLNKLLEEGPTKEVKDGSKLAAVGKSLAECSPEQAQTLITETFDVKLLEKWRKLEKRDEIRLAIANQLDEIKKNPNASQESEGKD